MHRWLTCAVLCATLVARAEAGDEDSPRHTVRTFLEDASHGRWLEAGRLLTKDPDRAGPQEEALARLLKDVFDATIVVQLDDLSESPEGQTDDHLHPGFEEIARVPVGRDTEPVRLQRVGGRWIFAPGTVSRIEAWHDALPDSFMRRHVPDALMRPASGTLLWWQLLAFPFFVLGALGLGRALQFVLRLSLRALTRRTASRFDDELVVRLKGPVTLFGATFAAWLLLPLLVLGAHGRDVASAVLSSLALASVFWAALRSVDVADEAARESAFVKARPETLALLPLARKTAKIVLTSIAVVSVLQKLGYPAASLVAGLGIGGLAFALAAQKTIEHLFGGVVLGLDQPFRPGDLVKVEELMGFVDSVGLRSTRIRTLQRTTVTIPNGRLADLRIETFATRDRIRLGAVLGLVYSTKAEALRAIVKELEASLNAHPKRFADEPARVFLIGLGSHSLDLELTVWIATTDFNEFQALRQDILLDAMAIVAKHGSELAFPTRTIVQAR